MTNNTTSFSVIIPRKNETDMTDLLSLLSREKLVAEVIVIDDHSDVDFSTADRALLEGSAKFTVIRVEQGRGQGYCRNLGIQKATAPYTLFIDADDMVVEEYFAEIAVILKANPALDAARFGYFVAKNKQPKYPVPFPFGDAAGSIKKGRTLILPSGKKTVVDFAYSWAGVYRTEFLKKNDVKFCETYSAEDFYFSWTLLLADPNLLLLNRQWYLYEKNKGVTGALSKANLTYIESFEKILELKEVSANIGFFGKALRQFLSVSVNHIETCKKNSDFATETYILENTFRVLNALDRKWVYVVLCGLPRAIGPARAILEKADFYTRLLPSTFENSAR